MIKIMIAVFLCLIIFILGFLTGIFCPLIIKKYLSLFHQNSISPKDDESFEPSVFNKNMKPLSEEILQEYLHGPQKKQDDIELEGDEEDE